MSRLPGIRIAVFLWLLRSASALAFPVAEIRSEGLLPEQWEQAKSVTGLLPGDEYDRLRVERAEGRLREYFDSKGYPQNEVSHEVIQKGESHSIRFNFKLGPVLKLESLAINVRDPVFSRDLELRLMRLLDVKPGEPFDRDRIKDLKHTTESFLSSQSFIDSRVREMTTEVVEGGIRLKLDLDIGERVVFSVQGNSFFSKSELMEQIEAQRNIGLGRDYVSVLMGRISDQYVQRGFRKVRITPYFFEAHGNEPKKVLFDIEEGPRSLIRSVIFDGNEAFSDEELTRLFFQNAEERIRARIYNGKMIETAAASLVDELKKRGYLSAKLIGVKTDELPGGKDVSIRIFINEGLQTRVQAIEFRGNHAIPSESLAKSLGIQEGDPLDLSKLEDGLDRIKRAYRALGYLDFRFSNEGENSESIVFYSEKNQIAYLSLEVDEGSSYLLGGIEIFGNEITRRRVIDREILLKIGELITETKLIDTENRLRRLGIFSQVNLELKGVPGRNDQKVLKITVQESIPGNTTAGIGFRNDLGIRAFGGLSYSNLWGLNHTWALDLTVNRRVVNFRFLEYTAQVSYTMPWSLLGETTLRPSISAEKRQYLEFNAETFAFNTALERMLYRPLRISGLVSYTLESIRQFNAVDPTQNQQITIGSVTPTLRMDLRDNPLSPKRGFYTSSSFELANQFFGAQREPVPVSYGRFQTRNDFHWNFVPSIVWFGSLRGGWLKNFTNPRLPDGSIDPKVSVPLIKQFALGGINSIRGFSEQEINVQASDPNRRVQGFLTYVNYRTQLDFFPSPSFSIGPFLDAGNLKLDEFSLGMLRFGSGIGFRYVTPAGPVNFDWGFKLNPRPGEAPNVFYFSLGII